VESRFRLVLGEQVVGFAHHVNDGGNLVAAHLFQRNRVVDEDLLDLDAETLEHDLPRQVGGTAAGVECHFPASEILECRELPAGIDMHLRVEQRRDVVNALSIFGSFSLRRK